MSAAKQILFFIAQIFFCVVCFAQREQIDSLKKILPSLHDTDRIDCLNELSYCYTYISKKDSATYYAAVAENEARKLNYIHGIAESVSRQAGMAEHFENNFFKEEGLAKKALSWYNLTLNKKNINIIYDQLSFAFFAQSYYNEAIYWTKKAYEYDKKTGNEYEATEEICSLAAFNIERGDYDKGFDYAQQYLQLALKFKNEAQIKAALNVIGQLYLRIENYPAALNYYRQSLNNISKDDSLHQAKSEDDVWMQMEFAQIYCHLQQYDSALYRYNLFDSAKADEKDLRVFLVSKGEYYFAQKEYDNALKNFREGLYYHEKRHDRNEIMRVLLDIAKTYFAQNNTDSALQFGKQGLNMALETNARQFIRDGYQILYSVYDRLPSTDSAYFYYQKYIIMKEVVLSDQMKGKFAAYSYEQKIALLDEEKQMQRQQLNESAQQKTFLIIGIFGILLLGVFIFRTILLKRKNEKHLRVMTENELKFQKLESEKTKSEFQQQATELEMQALRAQMNPHFIFNSLNSINRFILQNNKAQASEYLTKFSKLVRMILQNSQASLISLESELESLKLYLEMESLRFNYHFDYKISVPKNLEIDMLKVPPLIIQPYVENAIWHGLMHKDEKGQLDIEISQENNYLFLKITDDGIGRKQSAALASKSATKHKSMGLRITADRIAMMQNSNGEQSPVTINDLVNADGSAAGTEVIIKMPVIQ